MEALAVELKVSQPTLSRVERGIGTLSIPTARALASWLDWTLEQVLDAAEAPAPAGTT